MEIKIATLNLCLGLQNKKPLIKQILIQEKIDILCLQETELNKNFDHNLLSFPGFCYESETNDIISRVGIYIKNDINFVRKTELEGVNQHLIVIDIVGSTKLRLINVYRCFNPGNGINAKDFFIQQLNLIRSAFTENTIIVGDFNLDWGKKSNQTYAFKRYFEEIDVLLNDLNLVQLVNFPTWSRMVNNNLRESILDHIYVSNPLTVRDLKNSKPTFGDHLLVSFLYNCKCHSPVEIVKRSWVNYDKNKLADSLSKIDWNITDDTVQGFWNQFENKLLGVVDGLAPLQVLRNGNECNSKPPPHIKNKINVRKRLLRQFKHNKTMELKERLKALDKSIKSYYVETTRKRVRKMVVPGNTNSLWKAVKTAMDVNISSLPKTMYDNETEISSEELPDRFACYFDSKIARIKEELVINDQVYNGTRKLVESNKNFMDPISVKECILSLKLKNSEGYDRIPQRILIEGVDFLTGPISRLMNMIYESKTLPDQWLVAKTIPVYKNKGPAKDIKNYRPIANLCSTSKVFEKLILKRIMDIQTTHGEDLTGVNQHGFKKARSTSTLTVQLQSMIANALNDDQFGMVASLDLSSAFDVVNIDLLLKRLKIIGLPDDVISLIEVWLKNRSFYVSLDGENSILFDLLLGTVQGSILGPILYALYISPLFDLEFMLTFADDNYIARFNYTMEALIKDMKKSIESITKWLRDSGLSVNKSKTEICTFHKKEVKVFTIIIDGTAISTQNEMNVLGVMFDTRMQWDKQVSGAITKANKALNAIRLIRRYFNTNELLQLLTSNYYSILYYNSEVWMISSLKCTLKKNLFSASANAIKMAFHYPKSLINYNTLHQMANRATPEMFSKYKLSLLLYKLYNSQTPLDDWVQLNLNQYFTPRQTTFMINLNINNNAGKNILCNRLNDLNGQISLDDLNLSLNGFKIKCKELFLTY